MADSDSDVEPAVVSVARRDPIDVTKALKAARALRNDEELAKELVSIAVDADKTNVGAVLRAIGRIRDPVWRGRTLFSALQQLQSRMLKSLPAPAQDSILSIVESIAAEDVRAEVLRRMPLDLPKTLQGRLAALGDTLGDPLQRLLTLLYYDPEPSQRRARALVRLARGIDDDDQRARALGAVAGHVGPALVEETYAAAKAIADPDAAARALVLTAARFEDDARRQQAQIEILRAATSVQDPILKFDVLASLHDLPAESKRATEIALFEHAARFDDPQFRSRAMFVAGNFTGDGALKRQALLAGIAAAELVRDENLRAALFQLLRGGIAGLEPAIRRELTRAVERMPDSEAKQELYRHLGRFFVYEREQEPAVPQTAARKAAWDLFISYATADLENARFLASELRSRGMRVFLSADVLDAAVGSATWLSAIDDALAGSRALLVLITEASLASKWVRKERTTYYRRYVATKAGRLFSIRLSGPPTEKLPPMLRKYQVIDSPAGRIEPGHLTRIMDIVRGE